MLIVCMALFNFYPRPPRGGRRGYTSTPATANIISIHALREEGDDVLQDALHHLADFYPRPPRGGRPANRRSYCTLLNISIHALREEGDACAVAIIW